jgi:hypothetical protein
MHKLTADMQMLLLLPSTSMCCKCTQGQFIINFNNPYHNIHPCVKQVIARYSQEWSMKKIPTASDSITTTLHFDVRNMLGYRHSPIFNRNEKSVTFAIDSQAGSMDCSWFFPAAQWLLLYNTPRLIPFIPFSLQKSLLYHSTLYIYYRMCSWKGIYK